MRTKSGSLNIVESADPSPGAERIDVLAVGVSFRLERIVSLGQVTPPGAWYDQDRPEWVMVVSGRARLRFDGEDRDLELAPGDTVLIEAGRRHRVTWTDPEVPTVWLGLHFDPEPQDG